MVLRGQLQVDVWKGDWGLPSVDLDCLLVLAYLKFNAVEIQINNATNPFFTPEGKFPVVRTKGRTITKFEELVSFMEDNNISSDYGLTKKQAAETQAYAVLLKEKLLPALQFVWWIDSNNEKGVITSWYSKVLPYPFNFYYPGKYKRNAENMLASLYENIEDDKDIEAKVIGDAEKCLTSLSVRLGTSDFMFGSHPTLIDAMLYAYLAPLLKAPLRSTSLQNHLKACTNLNKFVSRISQRYFSKEYYEYENKIKSEMKNKKDLTEQDPDIRRNQFLAVFVAAVAMYAYAVSVGLIKKASSKA